MSKTKGILAAASALSIVAVSAAVIAYGPERQTLYVENGCTATSTGCKLYYSDGTLVTNQNAKTILNSITNNPVIKGDERNFVALRENDGSTDANKQWYDDLEIIPGKEYIVRMYVHNNSLDLDATVAKNVRAKVNVPTTTGKENTISGFLNWDNSGLANGIWDSAKLHSDQNFTLAYKQGSAKWWGNVDPKTGQLNPSSGKTLATDANGSGSNDLVENVGENLGNVRGCFYYSGYVTFVVTPQFATSVTVNTLVRKEGADVTSYAKNYNANPGDTVQFQIEATNASQAQINNMIVRAVMGTGLTYVPGTTEFSDSTTSWKWVSNASNNLVATSGNNYGKYAASGNVFVRFKAKVAAKKDLPCGTNQLRMAGQATDFDAKPSYTAESIATVTATGETCQNNPDPSKPDSGNEDKKDTTTVVKEYAKAGPESVIAPILGAGSLATAAAYYVISRKQA
jgi:uncharacterized repeat protein (TIGR01451 family)